MTNPAPDSLRLVPEPRAIDTAPRDGTMLRLWVRYPENEDASWTPLDDAHESWTIGFNNFDNTEEDRWQVVGWCWSHDHLVEAADDVEVLGWLPFHGDASAPAVQPAAGREEIAALMREPMVAVTSLDGTVREPLVCLTVAERDAILAAISTPAQASGEPVAWARRWFIDGITPKKERNENGRMAWPKKFIYHEVTRVKVMKDDVALYAHPPAQASETGGEVQTLRVLLDNLVIAQSLSRELRQLATDQARSYLYQIRQAALSAPQAAPGEGEQS